MSCRMFHTIGHKILWKNLKLMVFEKIVWNGSNHNWLTDIELSNYTNKKSKQLFLKPFGKLSHMDVPKLTSTSKKGICVFPELQRSKREHWKYMIDVQQVCKTISCPQRRDFHFGKSNSVWSGKINQLCLCKFRNQRNLFR